MVNQGGVGIVNNPIATPLDVQTIGDVIEIHGEVFTEAAHIKKQMSVR